MHGCYLSFRCKLESSNRIRRKLMRNDLIRHLCSVSSVKKLSIVVEIQFPLKKYNNLSQGRTQINTSCLYKNCKSFLIIYKLSNRVRDIKKMFRDIKPQNIRTANRFMNYMRYSCIEQKNLIKPSTMISILIFTNIVRLLPNSVTGFFTHYHFPSFLYKFLFIIS